MATSLISQLLEPSALVIVDELTSHRRWPALKTKSVEITVESSMADIPFANSSLSTQDQVTTELRADLRSGKIIKPSRIKAKLISDDISIIIGIINVWEDVTHQLSITSKEIMSEHMSITDVEILQSPDKMSAVDIEITFEQSGLTTTGGFFPGQDGDKSTYGVHVTGETGLLSTAQGLYNKVLNLVGV